MTYFVGADINGYSFFFQVFTGLGALLYLFLGLIFLNRVLKSQQISNKAVSLTLIAILFGTNLFYYSMWQPTMSHVFSFFAMNGFLWYTSRAIQEWNIKTAAWMGLFLGLTCLIRPSNAVVLLLIPFMARDGNGLQRFFKMAPANKRAIFLLLVICLFILSIQGVLWYIQTGRFFVWSYRDEGFHFRSPEIMNVLFSFRKGLFVYTPLLLVALFGLLPLIARKRLQFISLAGFLIVSTYVVSSWWNWYYGDGFGLRAFIDYYGVFALLLGLLINMCRTRLGEVLVIVLLTLFVFVNLVQTWQYTHLVIQPNSMNATKYKYIFMRTDSSVVNCLGGNEEIAGFTINLHRPVRQFFNDFENPVAGWTSNSIVQTDHAYSGNHAGYLDSVHPYSPGIAIQAGQLCKLPASCFLTGELMVRDSLSGAGNHALVVLSMDSIHPGENWWQGFRLNDIPVDHCSSWRKCKFSLMLPAISDPDKILKVYIWNTGKKPMLVDDFVVRVYGELGRW